MKAAPIALVNVPYGTGGESMRPLGLSYLGAYLRANKILAKGFDFSDSRKTAEELVRQYSLTRFPIVGLSFYNVNASLAYRMARCIKRHNPECHVVAGGPHASAAQATIFSLHPEIDIVVRNEGEVTLLELIKALENGGPLGEVSGISFHSDKVLVVGPERSRLDNLDELPPPVFRFEGVNPERPHLFADRTEQRLKRATALVTSRSCPYSCSFCAIILIGRQWRACSPEKVVSDLAALEKSDGNHYEHIYFFDANFFVNVERVLKIGEALQRYRKGLTFSFSTRVNQLIKGRDFLPTLHNLGLRSVELGIESASPDALRRFAKDTKPEQNVEAIRLLRNNRIQLGLDFIMFDAEASIQDLQLNLDFLDKMGLDSYIPWDHVFSYMTPYLGTKIRSHYESLLQQKFDEDTLPEPASLLIDGKVRLIFTELWKMRAHLPRLSSALRNTEAKLNGHWSPAEARLKLNAITFRRLPFVVLRNLLEQASRGHDIRIEEAMPRFKDDNDQSSSLETILDYALQ